MKGLYAIVDASVVPRAQLAQFAAEVIRGGATVVQYRDKHASDSEFSETAQGILAVCKKHSIPLILNDHPQKCLDVGADGVHLGKDDMKVDEARALLGPNGIIGRSCYNDLNLANGAEHSGADYVAFGAIYGSTTKPEASPATLDTLVHARKEISIPVVAIGGITPDNAPPVISAGADMIAVISGLAVGGQPFQNAQRYQHLFQNK